MRAPEDEAARLETAGEIAVERAARVCKKCGCQGMQEKRAPIVVITPMMMRMMVVVMMMMLVVVVVVGGGGDDDDDAEGLVPSSYVCLRVSMYMSLLAWSVPSAALEVSRGLLGISCSTAPLPHLFVRRRFDSRLSLQRVRMVLPLVLRLCAVSSTSSCRSE